MSVEERGQHSTSAKTADSPLPPSSLRFISKVLSLAERARTIQSEPLKNLAHFMDKEWFYEAWKRLRKGAAYGIDAVSSADYQTHLDTNIESLLFRLRQSQYQAPPVKRVYIPKSNGKQRPLGLPTIEDKLLQRAVGIIVSTVYEQEFLNMSYGFRSRRSAHQAVEGVKTAIATGKVSWVVDADIQSFFDEMDHDWLLKFVSHRIKDKTTLSLIEGWLKAGVMEDGKLFKSSTGAPQGGVISPVLANIYLHYVIDLWVTKVVKNHLRGEMYCFRYADDTLFAFQYRRDAVRFMEALKNRLSKFNLRLNEEKTKLCRFGRFAERDRKRYGEKRSTFGFLGFTFYNSVSRQGKYKVGVRTQSKRLCGSMNRVAQWCKANRHQPILHQARYLKAMLQGHYQYYGVSGNFKSVAAFYRHVIRVWHRYLSRRSQRAYIKWDKYVKILSRVRLTKPYLPHAVNVSY